MHKTYKSYAKINIFLKLVGFKDGLHQINSRFVRLPNLYDVMWFEKSGTGFDVVGDFDCDIQDNTITRAKQKLIELVNYQKVRDFCELNKVVVYKQIPKKAGLGGGSSNAATFLSMINQELNLQLSTKDLMEIGKEVGADVNFFLSGFLSANVSGFGEIIEEFEEEPMNFEVYTPKIECSTRDVYKHFYRRYKDSFKENKALASRLCLLPSKDILANFDAKSLNDLFVSASSLYPELLSEFKENYFFSGSGSSFFAPKCN